MCPLFSTMAKTIKITSLTLFLIFISLLIPNFFFENDVLLSITITVGVFTYHFVMRLSVGYLINSTLKNKVNYNKWWFREKSFEQTLYNTLRVKKWKKHMPTYSPDTFDVNKHSLEEIVSATCQSEIVHEIIFVLSFLPILLAIPFGTLGVFIATSVIAALIDCIFIIMQRFNRPRLLKIIARKHKTH